MTTLSTGQFVPAHYRNVTALLSSYELKMWNISLLLSVADAQPQF